MTTAEPGGEREPDGARRREPRSVPPARRNADRRRKRAARAANRRKERRRRDAERRRQREQREAQGGQAAVRVPEPAPVRSSRPEPPDPPGLDRLRSAEPAPQAAEPEPWRVEVRRDAAAQGGHASGTAPGGPSRSRPSKPGRAGRRKVTVRRVDPWSVFRLSLVLYFCLLVVVTLGLVIFWLILSRMPLLQRTLEAVERLGIPIDPGLVLTVLLPVGVLNVLLWSGANLFFAVLYNLVADLVGGLGVTLAEDDPRG